MKDAIIVLGGGVDEAGQLPEIPKNRIDKGIELFEQKVAPILIFSGKWGFMATFTPRRPEAEAMAEYAISHGIPADAIVQETTSMDTMGNAFFTKQDILEPRGWRNVTVVTSEYHLNRTKYIFNKILGPDYQIDYMPADSRLTEDELAAKAVTEQKVLAFIQEHLGPIIDGDDAGVFALLQQFPGYSDNPKYTIEELRELVSSIKR